MLQSAVLNLESSPSFARWLRPPLSFNPQKPYPHNRLISPLTASISKPQLGNTEAIHSPVVWEQIVRLFSVMFISLGYVFLGSEKLSKVLIWEFNVLFLAIKFDPFFDAGKVIVSCSR